MVIVEGGEDTVIEAGMTLSIQDRITTIQAVILTITEVRVEDTQTVAVAAVQLVRQGGEAMEGAGVEILISHLPTQIRGHPTPHRPITADTGEGVEVTALHPMADMEMDRHPRGVDRQHITTTPMDEMTTTVDTADMKVVTVMVIAKMGIAGRPVYQEVDMADMAVISPVVMRILETMEGEVVHMDKEGVAVDGVVTIKLFVLFIDAAICNIHFSYISAYDRYNTVPRRMRRIQTYKAYLEFIA